MMSRFLEGRGYDIAMAADGFDAGIKVLAVSGHDTQENREKILKADANGFLSKPIDVKTILEELRRFCQPEKSLASD